MVKYEYNPHIEGFKRVDNRGHTLDIDIVEARRIVALKNLGYSVTDIFKEMDLARKISVSTLRTFLKNYENGNISIEGEFPVPQKHLDEMDNEVRIDDLERRIKSLEEWKESFICSCQTEITEKSTKDKVKEWLKI